MQIKFILVLFLLLMAQAAHAQPVNTNISNGILFDGEPYLAINPTNKQNLVVAWMGLKYTAGQYRIAIKTSASIDGGKTWSVANTLPHFGTGFGSADISMAFYRNGLLYISYIDYRQLPDSGGIYVARSVDGGLNWDEPSKAFDMYEVAGKRAIDRPWLTVDNSNTSNAGTLYITTKPAPWIAPPNRCYYKVSSDSGHTWSSIANLDRGTHLVGNAIAAPMAAPAVTTGGKFCAAYPSYVASQNIYPAYYLATSADKGQTLSYTTIFAALPGVIDSNFKNGYQLITHPSDSNKMAFLIPDARSGDADILAFYSNDGGLTWSNQVRVNDDSIANGKAEDLVWAAYNEKGNIVVTWRDRRNASANGFWNAGYDFYYASSTNNAQSFSANQKLSNQFIGFDSILTANGNDFMSCAYTGDTLYTVWGDNRSGKMNIYFVKTIASTNTNIGICLLEGSEPAWNLYPNPAGNELNVLIPDEMIVKKLLVFDASGKEVDAAKVVAGGIIKIDLRYLPKGIYFLKLNEDVKRFLKE